MAESAQDGLDEHRTVAAGVDSLLPELERTGNAICATLQSCGRVYTFGNGGSAARMLSTWLRSWSAATVAIAGRCRLWP